MVEAEKIKELLCEEKHQIKMYDLVADETRKFLSQTTAEDFSIQRIFQKKN
ncbi:MAG: hypothetical protein HOC71_09850 [Candidatus Latescibacteria bacterium]|mgnify:FL=1|jgi:hypothetical protein|nr:hypothetical protein [Candidatus Latescibacterota bacterium]